jgi:hypothetical protein
MNEGKTIPREATIKLYDEIRVENERKNNGLCYGCYKHSKGDYSKMCLSFGLSGNNNTGCNQINKRYFKEE